MGEGRSQFGAANDDELRAPSPPPQADPSTAQSAPQAGPSTAPSVMTHPPRRNTNPRIQDSAVTHTPCLISPFGIHMAENVHLGEHWQDIAFVPPQDLPEIADPDDRLPGRTDRALIETPLYIPTNVEAMAQWCTSRTKIPTFADRMSVAQFKTSVTLLSELPVCLSFRARHERY